MQKLQKKKTGNDSIIQIYPLFSQVTAIKTHNSTKNVTFLFNYFHFPHTFSLQSCVSAGPEWLFPDLPMSQLLLQFSLRLRATKKKYIYGALS